MGGSRPHIPLAVPPDARPMAKNAIGRAKEGEYQ